MAISVGDAVIKIVGDTKDLDRSMAGLKDRVKKGMQAVSTQLRVVGAGFTAVGVASLKLIGDARKLNAQFATTALGLKSTTKEVRELALETTNVTFPLRSVAATFDLLTRAGVRDQEMLMQSATAFDTLGDATGASAEAIAELLIPAFKLFGEDIPTTAAELDRFTFLTKKTTVDLQDFGTMLTRMAPEMDTLNLSMDDAVLVLAALSEKGIEGSAATLLLRTAITDMETTMKDATEEVFKIQDSMDDLKKRFDEGTVSTEEFTVVSAQLEVLMGTAQERFREVTTGQTAFFEALGITQEAIDALGVEMKSATGITQEYADAANTQFGVMDKLKQKWSELTLRAGSFLQPMESVLAGVSALGPIMMALSTSVGASTVAWIVNTVATAASKVAMGASVIATGAMTAAQWLLNAALSANPIGLVVVAIIGLIAVGVLLWKNWDTIKEKALLLWEKMQQVFRAISDFIGEMFRNAVGFVQEGWDKILAILFPSVGLDMLLLKNWIRVLDNVKAIFGMVVHFVKENWDKILAILFPAVGLPILIARNWGVVVGFVKSIFGNAKGVILDTFKDTVNGVIELLNGLISRWNKLKLKIPRISIDIPKIKVLGKTIFPGVDLAAGPWTFEFPDTPAIPKLQKGVRNFSGGLAIVGERGAELVNLPSGSDVTPIGSGLVVNIDMSNAVIYGEMDFEQRIMTAIRDNNLGGGVAP